MTIDRAIEILNPEHREHYESIDPVNEACRMGMEALERTRWIPCSEKLPEEWIDNDDNTYINYLIYMPYLKAADVGVYNGDEESWLFRGVEVKVSHWMPLPDAPEEESNGN